MDDAPFDAEVLDEPTCWRLLRGATVGRLAMCIDGRPLILPVNFACDGTTIVFRTAAGTKLAAASDRTVAFEVDGYDTGAGEAWSVVVVGRGREIVDPDELERTDALALFPWHLAPKAHFVAIAGDEVSGRRFRAPYATSATSGG